MGRGPQAQAQPRLADLAQRLEVRHTWSAIVLPPAPLAALRAVLGHARQQAVVDHEWGFTPERCRRGRIGGAVRRAERHRQDAGRRGDRRRARPRPLPHRPQRRGQQVHRRDREEPAPGVRRRRAAAARCCCSTRPTRCSASAREVKDSHDRYANIEVSYLLQRMETYRGLAILTTNLRTTLDAAFLRRLRFVVEFPFPDAARDRPRSGGAAFPPAHAARRLDLDRLAQLNLAGGNIRNIALQRRLPRRRRRSAGHDGADPRRRRPGVRQDGPRSDSRRGPRIRAEGRRHGRHRRARPHRPTGRTRRYQVAATFERELRRLIAERPLDPAGVRRLGAGHTPTLAIDVDLAANPVIVGAAIARSVVEALHR